MSAPVLALDTGSREVSVALADAGAVLAARSGAQRGSSGHLVEWIDACLAEAGVRLDQLAGAVALRGPGSFTGLRIGLATLLGIHQATDLPATALPTLHVLAASVAEAAPPGGGVLALVPAGPGEWYAQLWTAPPPGEPDDEPRRLAADELGGLAAACCIVGSREEAALLPALGIPVRVAGPLAPVAARLAARQPPPWDATLLQAPLYLAPPPVTLPGPPKRIIPVTEPTRGRR